MKVVKFHGTDKTYSFFRTRDSAEIKPVDDEEVTPVYSYYSWELTRRFRVQSHVIRQKNFEKKFCVITSFCGPVLGSYESAPLFGGLLWFLWCVCVKPNLKPICSDQISDMFSLC